MNTFETMDRTATDHLAETVRSDRDGAAPSGFAFAASALPVFGASGIKPTGIALSFAADEAESCGEDRFALCLVDAAGAVLASLGPFCEDEVVAIWRDLAARTGLPRMIVREDGVLAVVAAQVGRLMLGKTRIRRRHGSLGDRRPRFLVRRKTGRLPVRPQIHRGENEIIARS
ncbi:DUF6101 family protein [Methylobacterium sp. WL8]|uniref:DUF6101 family protein n=1 Tax=Methylobacterium sp. WL8 TaxID=2603899 RepID=UPI00165032E2|nr:DUF6101 family protein [Methylobacterium sp. WL8]